MHLILTKMTDVKKQLQKGFTLIELSIVMIIMGLLIAGGGTAYTQYVKEKRLDNTALRTDQIVSAIGNFRSSFGRYPCPASLTDTNTNATYGRETDCTDFSQAPGTCAGGICTEERADAITFLSGGVAINAKPLVRSGYVPFRALNLPEEFSYDGQGNKIKYVVTQHLTIDVNFEANTGAIDILNDQGTSIVEPQRSAHFLVISHGTDQAGAYTHAGVKIPCPAGIMEADNCTENRVNANYRLARASTNNVTGVFDDTVLYFIMDDNPLWQQSSSPGAQFDIHQKPSGDIAVAPPGAAGLPILNGAEIPTGGGPIRSTIRAKQDIMTNELCDRNGANCFPSSLISGPIDGVDDLDCPAGEVMELIDNKLAGCKAITTSFNVKCPTGQRLTGFDSSGSPLCSTPPAKCPSKTVGICGTTQTLPAGFDKDVVTITAGSNGKRKFKCDVPNWVITFDQTAPGDCACIPATTSGSVKCGTGFTGRRSFIDTFVCPPGGGPGSWTGKVFAPSQSFAAQCTCITKTKSRKLDCPKFWTGKRIEKDTHICTGPGAPKWTGWQPFSNTCVCKNKRKARFQSCPNGLNGLSGKKYQQESFLDCSVTPATWSTWTDVAGKGQADVCKCEAWTKDRENSCPVGSSGKWYELRDFTCPSGPLGAGVWDANWREDSARPKSSCVPDPIVTCYWKNQGTGLSSNPAIGGSVGSPCSCGDVGSCHLNVFAPFQNYFGCSCQ